MLRLAIAAWLAMLVGPAFANSAGHPLSIRLAPQVADGKVKAIAVTETFDVGPMAAGTPLLSLPAMTESVPGVLRDPATLTARDASGALPLKWTEDRPDPTLMKRDYHWRVARASSGVITVRYLAWPRVITADTKPAALKDMRTEAGGIHGSTKVLFAVPASGWPRKVRIDWDLDAMAPGSRAMTSFGEGSTVDTLDATTLTLGYFMAGPWQKIPAHANSGFMVYYLTPPDFALAPVVRDVAATYRYATALFGTKAQPFRALMRTTERFQGGGTGGRNSFMFGTVKGEPRTQEALKNLLTHESLHNWIGSLPKGPQGLWFVEGATNYYEAILPYRFGHRTLAQVTKLIGEWTRNYYGNAHRTLGTDAAAAAFWSDPDAQLLPYSRGPLYIALVDARLRAASGGRQRVDALVRTMVHAIRQGNASESVWLSLVTKALGEQGRRDFADLKAGRMLDLPASLFGPCLRRERGPVRRYLPGFHIGVTAAGQHVVKSVHAGSAAAEAGLRKGDEVLNDQVMKTAAERPGKSITLKVKTPDGRRDVHIDPWGEARDGYRWVQAVSRPAKCAL